MGNPKKVIFQQFHTNFRLFTLSQKKQTATVVLQLICLLTVVYYFLLELDLFSNSVWANGLGCVC